MDYQPGHYLEKLSERLKQPINGMHDKAKQAICGAIDLALSRPKFFLPFNGNTLEIDVPDLKIQPPLRLPYPIMSLEFPLDLPGMKTFSPGAYGSARCVAILLEANEHIHIISWMWYKKQTGQFGWSTSNYVSSMSMKATPYAKDNGLYCGISAREIRTWEYLDTETELIEDPLGHRALCATLNLIAALRCTNVHTDSIPASSALNKKRMTNGKPPFSEYKILTISQPKGYPQRTGLTGTHASPRQHLRRGHIRHLADERLVWVNQCLVGNAADGHIVKDYRVEATV